VKTEEMVFAATAFLFDATTYGCLQSVVLWIFTARQHSRALY